MRNIYLISILALIAVTLVGCGSTEMFTENTSPIEIALEGSTEPETAAPTEVSSFSAGSELFAETSLKSETLAEAETTAVTEAVPVEIPHTVATEPQAEVPETTHVISKLIPLPQNPHQKNLYPHQPKRQRKLRHIPKQRQRQLSEKKQLRPRLHGKRILLKQHRRRRSRKLLQIPSFLSLYPNLLKLPMMHRLILNTSNQSLSPSEKAWE